MATPAQKSFDNFIDKVVPQLFASATAGLSADDKLPVDTVMRELKAALLAERNVTTVTRLDNKEFAEHLDSKKKDVEKALKRLEPGGDVHNKLIEAGHQENANKLAAVAKTIRDKEEGIRLAAFASQRAQEEYCWQRIARLNGQNFDLTINAGKPKLQGGTHTIQGGFAQGVLSGLGKPGLLASSYTISVERDGTIVYKGKINNKEEFKTLMDAMYSTPGGKISIKLGDGSLTPENDPVLKEMAFMAYVLKYTGGIYYESTGGRFPAPKYTKEKLLEALSGTDPDPAGTAAAKHANMCDVEVENFPEDKFSPEQQAILRQWKEYGETKQEIIYQKSLKGTQREENARQFEKVLGRPVAPAPGEREKITIRQG